MKRSKVQPATAVILLSCALVCVGLASPFIYVNILTLQHEAELRPVMERYLKTVQNAYNTLDVSHLSDIMTDDVAQRWIGAIRPEAGVYRDGTLTLQRFEVEEYSASRAVVKVTELYSNDHNFDSKTGETTTFRDHSETDSYTLIKVNGVWKVSEARPLD